MSIPISFYTASDVRRCLCSSKTIGKTPSLTTIRNWMKADLKLAFKKVNLRFKTKWSPADLIKSSNTPESFGLSSIKATVSFILMSLMSAALWLKHTTGQKEGDKIIDFQQEVKQVKLHYCNKCKRADWHLYSRRFN